MVILIRLSRVKKDTIYRVFSITDPGLVTFLMKMMNQMKRLKHNSFSIRESNLRQAFETQKDFGLAKYSMLLYSIKKTSPGNFYARNEGEKRRNSFEKVVMRKLRIFKVKSVFDSITFSKDFLDSIDEVLNIFDVISNNQIFSIVDEKFYQSNDSEFKLPHWFKQTSLNSFASWVVAYFERRIYLCFKEGESAFENKMPIQLRDEYLTVWNSMEEIKQEELISKVVDQADHFRSEAFGTKEMIPNYKSAKNPSRNKHLNLKGNELIKLMNWDEILFKLIWTLNINMHRMEGLSLEEFKDIVKNKIIILSKSGNSSFIYSCVAPNLVDSMKIEKFFMNMMVQYLHDLYIQKNIDELMKEEEDKKGKHKNKNKKKGKKRNKKRKKKKNKQKEMGQNESKQCTEEIKKIEEKKEINLKKPVVEKGDLPKREEIQENIENPNKGVIVEIVETETLRGQNRDEFMLKLRKKIERDGDKKGLLVPLLGQENSAEIEKKENQQKSIKIQKENQADVQIITEKPKSKEERAKFFCEKLAKLFKKQLPIDKKDTKSLCGKQEPEIQETHTMEEGSDYLYRSIQTTGMEGFWDDCEKPSLEGDSFFLSKKSNPQSDNGFSRLSKGGISFGCRSQSRKDKGECRSEGSKAISGKVKSFEKAIEEVKDLKIEEEIEQEIFSNFEVPLKPVKKVGKENLKKLEKKEKEIKKEEILKVENVEVKGDVKERKKSDKKKESYGKRQEKNKKKKKGSRNNKKNQFKIEKIQNFEDTSLEQSDPIIVLKETKKKNRKSRKSR